MRATLPFPPSHQIINFARNQSRTCKNIVLPLYRFFNKWGIFCKICFSNLQNLKERGIIMNDKLQKVFQTLSVQPNKLFRIEIVHPENHGSLAKAIRGKAFSIDERLNIHSVNDLLLNPYPLSYSKELLIELLINPDFIIKPIIIPTKEDYVALSYFKLAGYKYIAMDEDGAIWAFKHKPKKIGGVWGLTNPPPSNEQKGLVQTRCETPISFLTLEDLEPYPLDDL